jgi:hypothetical protein
MFHTVIGKENDEQERHGFSHLVLFFVRKEGWGEEDKINI